MASLFKAGDSKEFNYTGNIQSIELLPGKYIFECYGASGGGGSGASAHASYDAGGLGGYTKAIMEIIEPITVYCYVGGAGKYGGSGSAYGGPVGGWNGGGNGGNSSSGSGGGSTDFRIINEAWNNIDSLRSRFIVAGGGGGSDNYTGSYGDDGSGGSGGGLTAQGAWISGVYNSGYGATQTSGGSFGYGASVSTNTDTGGAGGGWYGGQVTNHNNGGAGGGSSYIKGYPGCNTEYHSYQEKVNYIEDGMLQVGNHNGNGYAKVTVILIYDPQTLTVINANGQTEILEKHATQPVSIMLATFHASQCFRYWHAEGISLDNPYARDITFNMPSNNVLLKAILEPNRLNTNIYKNIFSEEPFDMSYINLAMDNTITTTNDIKQDSHGLSVNDVVYLDDNGKYQKALAEDSAKAIAVGMVTKVSSHNVFTLMTTGRFPYDNMDHDDTSILYLSDKNPGKLVHYTEITNTVYVPVAVYTDNSIIINIQQGSIGDKMVPYTVEELEFELYSEAELNDVVNQIVSGVK